MVSGHNVRRLLQLRDILRLCGIQGTASVETNRLVRLGDEPGQHCHVSLCAATTHTDESQLDLERILHQPKRLRLRLARSPHLTSHPEI